MEEPRRQLVQTGDGSATLYVPGLDEHYHSKHGALQEARHVFIKKGLAPLAEKKKVLNILEIGLGTGLNALLTYQYALDHGLELNYTGVEKYPLNDAEIQAVNHLELIRDQRLEPFHQRMFQNKTDEIIEFGSIFRLEKQVRDFREINNYGAFDLIYYDAFGPRVQPHLWEKSLFELMYRLCKAHAVLVTYCAKGQVRRDMQAVGFEVERLDGPPGKREMLRATKHV